MQPENHPECRSCFDLSFEHIQVFYEQKRNIGWVMLNSKPRPSFTPQLLAELDTALQAFKSFPEPLDFLVTGSLIPGIFNAGGDLDLFTKSIRTQDLATLRKYGEDCVRIGSLVTSGLGRNTVTIAMVEGSALGGGFEAALTHHFIFAQQDVKMGFPEIAFNLFPGMGAYSFVARRAGNALAEKLVLSGDPKTAEWLEERNVVDRVFEAGDGFRTVRAFVDQMKPRLNGLQAILRTRQAVAPIPKDELLQITYDWAESALQLPEKDIQYMERLVQVQNRKIAQLKVA